MEGRSGKVLIHDSNELSQNLLDISNGLSQFTLLKCTIVLGSQIDSTA